MAGTGGVGATAGSAGSAGASTGGSAGTGGGGWCPRVDLGSAVPITHSASTVGLPNSMISQRLEWEDAPDDSLQFTAPETGEYLLTLSTSTSDFAVGASAEIYMGGYHSPAQCPADGQIGDIDGVYNDNQPDYPLQLTAGQQIVIYVSAPYWSGVPAGDYTLGISKK